MSVGEQLRKARLDSGLTLDRVSEDTKIQLWILQAIEHGEMSRVPGGVFVRGYLASFARAVGLDAGDIVTAYFGVPSQPAVTQPPPEPRRYTGTPIWQVVALAFLIITTAVVWRNTWRSNPDVDASIAAAPSERVRQAPPVASPAPSVAPAPTATEDSAQAVNSATPPTVAAVAPASAASVNQAASPAIAATNGTDAPKGPVDAQAAVASSEPIAPSEPVAPGATPLEVDVRATGDSWIEATADGERKAYRLFKAGEELRLDAREQVHLVVGDASAVSYTVNGTPAAPLGGIGVVRELTITPTGAN